MAVEDKRFEQLVEEHSGELFAYLWRMLHDIEDAEDGLQETYLRAYRAFSRLAPDSNARAWLYKIATNVARTQLRRNRRRKHLQAAVDTEALPSDRNVQVEVEERMFLHAVALAVERLPPKQKAAFMMRKYSGLTYSEISVALKSSEQAARANVYQALQNLRSELKSTWQERPPGQRVGKGGEHP
jgi:RNA polymerase sigma-70 factor (ECF subfamily)